LLAGGAGARPDHPISGRWGARHGLGKSPTPYQGFPRWTTTRSGATILASKPLTAALALKGVLVEYGPGGYSPSHTHAKSALIYATVIEGEVRSKVNDGPERTYRTGENWTELPGDHHRVSANASETKPAKILAVFVVDDQDTVLTIPDQK
jgi:quercetin dioxygenase-like cupin family protein